MRFLIVVFFYLWASLVNAQTQTTTDAAGESIVIAVTTDALGLPTTSTLSTLTTAATTPDRGPVGQPDATTGTPHAPIPFKYTTIIDGSKEVVQATFTPTFPQTVLSTAPATGSIMDYSEWLSIYGPTTSAGSSSSASSLVSKNPLMGLVSSVLMRTVFALRYFLKILWGSKIEQSPPTVSYEEFMANEGHGLHKCLQKIDKFGFSFVEGVPPTPEATEKLAERIGFIRETQYGKFWEFTSDLSKGDTAYTTLALGAHTDNTYFTDPCGLQLFHLLSHTDGSGGATLLVDGFYVASIVKELHPEMYDILSKVSVPAHAAGEHDSLYRPSPSTGYPLLRHDSVTGQLSQVRWNNDDRSVMRHLPGNLVEDWYNAIRTWHSCLTSPDSEYWVQLKPGTAVIINNHRVLHGRSAFDGKRRMCGAYIGMDEFQSKLAVLREKFAHNPDLRISEGEEKTRSVWSAYL
ncbi:hypothetical protein D9758_004034 [Tetrapyrgos nigripes]|uniref:TauD/TfdA-like domain-containing protein n=1 Tax=Tetrapyrgos nigripes TaxID=182062 RepID=A0A8H5GLT4_9AGAR|nr:hypothetical protein D9758_004034 [Tetrapyrgos nigripes]